MTEIARNLTVTSSVAVDSVRSLFDDLKTAEKAVKDIKAQIAAVKAALKGPARKTAKPTAGQVSRKPRPASRRRGLPTAPKPLAEASTADEV
jgi:hypothetical protein